MGRGCPCSSASACWRRATSPASGSTPSRCSTSGPTGSSRAIVEKPPGVGGASGRVLLSMNLWRFSPAIFEACRRVPLSTRGERELPQAVAWAIANRSERFRAVPCADGVLDLSTRADVAPWSRRRLAAGGAAAVSGIEERLLAAGLTPAEARRKRELFGQVDAALRAGRGRRIRCGAWFVPGRIEVLGKHTDYAGGRSLLCAVGRGFCVAASPRDDRVLRILDAGRRLEAEVPLDPSLVPASSGLEGVRARRSPPAWRATSRGPSRRRRRTRERPAAGLGPFELERARRRALHGARRGQRSSGARGVRRQHSEPRGPRRLPRCARERTGVRRAPGRARRRDVRRQRGPDRDPLQPRRARSRSTPSARCGASERCRSAERLESSSSPRAAWPPTRRAPRGALQPAVARGRGDPRALEPFRPARGSETSSPPRRPPTTRPSAFATCCASFRSTASRRSSSAAGSTSSSRSRPCSSRPSPTWLREERRRPDRRARRSLPGAGRALPRQSDPRDDRARAVGARARCGRGLGLRRRFRRQRLGARGGPTTPTRSAAAGREAYAAGVPEPDRALPLLRDAAGARGRPAVGARRVPPPSGRSSRPMALRRSPRRSARAAFGLTARQSLPRSAAAVAAIWLWVTARRVPALAQRRRVRARDRDPHVLGAVDVPVVVLPVLGRRSPRPWSVVIRKVVLSRYCGIACIVVQSSRMKPSTEWADCRTRSYRPLCAHSSVSP